MAVMEKPASGTVQAAHPPEGAEGLSKARALAAAPYLAKAGQKMTFEEYVKAFDGVEGIRTEWLGGEVGVYQMGNNKKHQKLFVFLILLLEGFLEVHEIGELITDGIPMRVSDDQPAREPDLLVILNEHLDRYKETSLEGVADVVIEIVSPESGARDRGEKFIEYEAAGVPEYWLIDPIRTTAQFFALSEDKHYRPLPLDGQGRLTSNVLEGFALDPMILWQEELPRQSAARALVDAMPRRA